MSGPACTWKTPTTAPLAAGAIVPPIAPASSKKVTSCGGGDATCSDPIEIINLYMQVEVKPKTLVSVKKAWALGVEAKRKVQTTALQLATINTPRGGTRVTSSAA